MLRALRLDTASALSRPRFGRASAATGSTLARRQRTLRSGSGVPSPTRSVEARPVREASRRRPERFTSSPRRSAWAGARHLLRVQALTIALVLGAIVVLSPNQGAAMYLPTGVDKGFGLRAGLERFGIADAAVAGFGDAENDPPCCDSQASRSRSRTRSTRSRTRAMRWSICPWATSHTTLRSWSTVAGSARHGLAHDSVHRNTNRRSNPSRSRRLTACASRRSPASSTTFASNASRNVPGSRVPTSYRTPARSMISGIRSRTTFSKVMRTRAPPG